MRAPKGTEPGKPHATNQTAMAVERVSRSPIRQPVELASLPGIEIDAPEREFLAEGIARSLAQYITTSHMMSGDSLPSERALGRMFRVSTRTIREALRILTEHGVVRTSQGKRATVSDGHSRALKRSLALARFLGKDQLSDLLELRFALEPRAAALAALRNEEADVEAISEALDRMRVAGTEVAVWVESDVAFHDAVMRATHNDFFIMVLGALSESLVEERFAGAAGRLAQGRTEEQTLREHGAIAKAIASRNAPLAERRMVAHLEQSLTYFWGLTQSESYSLRPTKPGGRHPARRAD
jgi:GntR family transcriptional regulator, transcriptional repressor for pyruvate dehydrogenase complex